MTIVANENHKPLPPLWKSLWVFCVLCVMWPMDLLDEMVEKSDTWREKYGENSPVLWHASEWVISGTAIGGFISGLAAIAAVCLAVLVAAVDGAPGTQFSPAQWMYAALQAAEADVACLVIALAARGWLWFRRGSEEDTPDDFKFRSPTAWLVWPVLLVQLASALMGYYLSPYFYIVAVGAVFVLLAPAWSPVEKWWYKRKEYVPHTRDLWLRDMEND